MRVIAAMSGGVDSAVAAARMVDAGHEVVGVHLALSTSPQTLRTGSRGCCSLEDVRDARRAADVLGIPFYVWDFAERFRDEVIDDFVATYAEGETPNPCLRCNERIKFAALLERAMALGFDAVATGHYARLRGDSPETMRLYRAVDAAKDQSYVLGVLNREQLAHSLFPLGDSVKTQVRAEAAERGLATVADKPDSHDICFIPTGDTRAFLGARLGVRSGPVIDAATGAEVARHGGVHGFTIGQRRGLGLPGPGPDGRPRYVVDIDAANDTVTIGPAEMLDVHELAAGPAVWLIDEPTAPFDCSVQVRAHGGIVPAFCTPTDDGFTLALRSPLRGVARGQAAVVYGAEDTPGAGERVLGGATIRSSVRTVLAGGGPGC